MWFFHCFPTQGKNTFERVRTGLQIEDHLTTTQFQHHSDPSIPCKEYTVALDELCGHVHSKRYADIRTEGQLAIELVQTQRNATVAIANGADFESHTTQNIVAILQLFYKDVNYLASLDETWLHIGGQREYLVL